MMGAGAVAGVGEFPKCPRCRGGVMLPLSDYGQDGASVLFKVWACIDSECGYTLRVDKGKAAYERIAGLSGGSHNNHSHAGR